MLIDPSEGRAHMQIKGQIPVPFDPGVALPFPTPSLSQGIQRWLHAKAVLMMWVVLGSVVLRGRPRVLVSACLGSDSHAITHCCEAGKCPLRPPHLPVRGLLCGLTEYQPWSRCAGC